MWLMLYIRPICTIPRFFSLPITHEGPTWACELFSPLCHTWPPLICSYLAITSQEWRQLLLTFMKVSTCLLKMLLSVRPSVRPTHRRSFPPSCSPPSLAAINSELPLTKTLNWAIHHSVATVLLHACRVRVISLDPPGRKRDAAII